MATPTPSAERRTQLWEAMRDYVTSLGGWVISVPGMAVMRIECRKDSSLPTKLNNLGYIPIACGATTRIEAGSFDQG